MNLQKNSLFSDFEETKALSIASRFRKVPFAKNDIIFREADEANSFIIVNRGEVAVSKGSPPDRRELARLTSGDSFGETCFICDSKRPATLTALCDTECLLMDGQTFLALMHEDLVFAQR